MNWSPPTNTGGELTGYIIEKRLSTTHKWEKVATVDTAVTQYTVENLKEKCEYYFRISAENEVGAGTATETEKVALRTSARKFEFILNLLYLFCPGYIISLTPLIFGNLLIVFILSLILLLKLFTNK